MWKRCGSGKPQQTAAANSAMWLAEPSERQAAVDRSSCSRLTSRRSPVRAGHRPSSRSRFRSGTAAITLTDGHLPYVAVEALWKRGGGHDGRAARLPGRWWRPASPKTQRVGDPALPCRWITRFGAREVHAGGQECCLIARRGSGR
jgi:hypothetical protein